MRSTDGDQTYAIVTAAATSSDAAYNGFNATDVSVTTPTTTRSASRSARSPGTTTEAGGAATFTVVLASQPTADVSVALSSGDTSEGTVAPAALTFTAATWNVAQTVTVTGVNDAVADGDQTYAIVTAAATSSDAAYNGFNATDVSVRNTDDDAVGITVSTISGLTPLRPAAPPPSRSSSPRSRRPM